MYVYMYNLIRLLLASAYAHKCGKFEATGDYLSSEPTKRPINQQIWHVESSTKSTISSCSGCCGCCCRGWPEHTHDIQRRAKRSNLRQSVLVFFISGLSFFPQRTTTKSALLFALHEQSTPHPRSCFALPLLLIIFLLDNHVAFALSLSSSSSSLPPLLLLFLKHACGVVFVLCV